MKIYSKRRALRIVSKCGWKLSRVAKQTEEICIVAVKNAGWALQYVQHQTPEICLAAVANYGKALKYVTEQTPDICFAAIREDPMAIMDVQEQTEALCRFAVMRDWRAIIYVRNQTEGICMAAIDNDPAAINYIRVENLTPRLLYYAAAKYLSDLGLDIDFLIDNYIAGRDKSAVSTPKVLTVDDVASKMQYQSIRIYKGSCADDSIELFAGDVKDLPQEHASLEIDDMCVGIDDEIVIHVK